jgi:hypothetical protein
MQEQTPLNFGSVKPCLRRAALSIRKALWRDHVPRKVCELALLCKEKYTNKYFAFSHRCYLSEYILLYCTLYT